MFFVGGGGGGGEGVEWALIRGWAVNRINTVNLLLTRLVRVRTGRISFFGLFCKDRAYASGRCSPSTALALGQ